MRVETENLNGPALDWAVANAEGYTFGDWHAPDGDPQVWIERVDEEGRGPAGYFPADDRFHYSTSWSQAGPIIEREIVELVKGGSDGRTYWESRAGFEGEPGHAIQHGPTPLIAAMRCFVCSKLGREVDVPDELINTI